MTGFRSRRLALAGCILLAATPSASSLPWKDANPLERLFGKPKPPSGPARSRPSKARAPAVTALPAIAAVPVPDARPERPDAAKAAIDAATEPATAEAPLATSDAAAEPSPPEPASVPKPEPVPPEPPADAARAATSSPTSDPAAGPTPDPADAPTPGSEPAPADIPAPSETAKKPIDEIPVPVERPEGQGSDAAPPAAAPEPPQAMPEPVRAVSETPDAVPETPEAPPTPPVPDAPNSTENLKSRTATVTPAASVLAAAAVEDAALCEDVLTERGVEFTVGESISEGDCGVLRPVNVKRLSSGIKVSPDTQFLCRTALALDDWMTAGVLPAVKAELPGRTLAQFRHASTYVCRPRASESGISEHARGSAIDIAAFVFDKGEDIGVEAQADGTPEAKFQAAVRAAACGPFTTVLGPGTDPDHATHFHLDIAARKTGATYCK